MRTFCRGREGAGRDGVHLGYGQLNACRTSGGEYALGIVEPGGGAGSDQVIKPGHFRFILRYTDCMCGAVGQQLCSGRGTKLIVNDRHLATLFTKTQHGFSEVGAAGGIHPAGAEDQMTGTERSGLFTRQLGFAVDVQRRGLVCLYPGCFTAAVEDVVGGVVHQPGAQRLGFFGDGGNAGGVEQLGEVAFALGFIHRGMRGGVDDHVRLQ